MNVACCVFPPLTLLWKKHNIMPGIKHELHEKEHNVLEKVANMLMFMNKGLKVMK